MNITNDPKRISQFWSVFKFQLKNIAQNVCDRKGLFIFKGGLKKDYEENTNFLYNGLHIARYHVFYMDVGGVEYDG